MAEEKAFAYVKRVIEGTKYLIPMELYKEDLVMALNKVTNRQANEIILTEKENIALKKFLTSDLVFRL